MRSRTVAFRLSPDGDTLLVEEFVDGNRNGVRTAEILSGVDPPAAAPMRLSDRFPRISGDLSGAVLMSFTPYGTATSRTVTLRGADGSQYAVRVLGASGRTRVLRYDTATGDWVDAL